jgi:hypothetical protein
MRGAGDDADGVRLRGPIIVLWRAGRRPWMTGGWGAEVRTSAGGPRTRPVLTHGQVGLQGDPLGSWVRITRR